MRGLQMRLLHYNYLPNVIMEYLLRNLKDHTIIVFYNQLRIGITYVDTVALTWPSYINTTTL
jgi:hypothetical protein